MWNDRTKALIGENNVLTLKNSHVLVVGIGGVGGHVCEMLARAGVGKLTIVDFDTVDETNINRQVVATTKTVGKLKTDVMKNILLEINPDLAVKTYAKKFDANFANELLSQKYDYVVDCIDDVQGKVDLICECKERNLNIVSAMGAGNRFGIPNFVVMDIYKTSNDGLAKVMRKKLRERKVENLDVVTCTEKAEKLDKVVGSISFYPAMCGCVLSAFVVNKLIGKM